MRQADCPGYRQMLLLRSGDRCGEPAASVTWGTLLRGPGGPKWRVLAPPFRIRRESHQHAYRVFDECFEGGEQLGAERPVHDAVIAG
mgnify:CR=1 FL=1